jgi:hypothetical protein
MVIYWLKHLTDNKLKHHIYQSYWTALKELYIMHISYLEDNFCVCVSLITGLWYSFTNRNFTEHGGHMMVLWTCIWEAFGFNQGWGNDYPDWDIFEAFLTFLRQTSSRRVLSSGHGCFLPNLQHFMICVPVQQPTLCSPDAESITRNYNKTTSCNLNTEIHFHWHS